MQETVNKTNNARVGWFSWQHIKESGWTYGTKFGKVAVKSVWGGIKGFTSTGTVMGAFRGALREGAPELGDKLSGIFDDLNQDRKIASLQNTATDLQNHQSLLEGQMTDLQAGLRDATAKQSEFQAQLSQIETDLENATVETKAELELQKQALEQVIKANKAAKEQMQTALEATQTQVEEVKQRMADSEQAIQILNDKSLSHEEKISSLNELAEKERQRMDAFEQQMNTFQNRLEEQEVKLNQHSQQIENLHQQHLELEKQVAENKENITANKTNIQTNRENISQTKRDITTERRRREKDVSQVKEKFQQRTQELSLSQAWAQRQTEQKLAAERAERERVETQAKANQKRNQELAAQLEALRREIRAEQFKKQAEAERLAKLNHYAELKAEKLELEKKLKTYAGIPDLADYQANQRLVRWLARPQRNKNNRPGKYLPLQKGSYLARKYTPQELRDKCGFEESETGIDFIIDTQQLEKDITQHFLTPSYSRVSPVDVDEKAKLLGKLTRNKELLLAFATELGLPSEELEEPAPEEKPQTKPTLKKKTKSPEKPKVPTQPPETSRLKLAVQQTVTDWQQLWQKIPGATAALSFPWWVYLLLPILLWLLKKLIWFYLFKPKIVVKNEEKKEEKKESQEKAKPEPQKEATKPKKRRKRRPKTPK
jgi:hypothetical protein